jgi:hypothetical protein
MRSFQKKLTATAAAAALLAALGAAFAQAGDTPVPPATQSTDPLDANSASADRNANVSQGTRVKEVQGNDMSTNGPMNSATPQSTVSQSSTSATTSTDTSTTTAAPSTTDNSSAGTSSTTDNSAATTTDNSPTPRADRN